ncbi:LacI family DNA-binding transcriptional regulator [Weissella paramesenteroides]|uniref:Transcriptional regulator, LacI family n=4 Tax=Weissella paramesenteroides TaxID=1249 RepID=C5R9P8_WEIPA|nr:LacI family DNA-binding transcriptional regulator [Weissella paramesenteroides]ATF42090.1 LacI family transcriptional regulator [Weissella paramesenteroides]EER75148.1 transcriptional regulator, LacI family [Weissella paramesenteroides ATCC 33313]MCS9983614.1 LacI family transcriptional regulator [Weissella paramesenteroides]MCS9997438.1 LacI family transcriptional regulator [Weissella paramesenteroides]MCT0259408.1 LacI family transcriptional regulator [Weissella paramesenteroides]
MVSISDVAHEAHVSKMTVSRVINHPEQVSPEIRKDVQRVISQLGYVQNRAGRALANNRHYNIAFILLDNVNEIEPYYAHLLMHLTDALREEGYTLEMRHDRNFDLTNVDGFLICGARHSDFTVLNNLPIPVVIYGTESGITSVDIDNQAGTLLATKLLISQHYQRLLFLGMDIDEPFATNREMGYRQAMREADREVEIYRLPNNEHIVQRFLQNDDLSANTGIIAATDRLGLGALRASRQQGLQVPDDIGIVGFDGIYIHQLAEQPLTTVQQPLKEIAGHMVQLLLAELSGKTVESVYVVPKLIHGETTK